MLNFNLKNEIGEMGLAAARKAIFQEFSFTTAAISDLFADEANHPPVGGSVLDFVRAYDPDLAEHHSWVVRTLESLGNRWYLYHRTTVGPHSSSGPVASNTGLVALLEHVSTEDFWLDLLAEKSESLEIEFFLLRGDEIDTAWEQYQAVSAHPGSHGRTVIWSGPRVWACQNDGDTPGMEIVVVR